MDKTNGQMSGAAIKVTPTASGDCREVPNKLLEMGQVLAGALAYAFQPWCGHLRSYLYMPWWTMAQPVVLSIPSLSQDPLNLLFHLGLDEMPSKEFFFSIIIEVAGGT